MQPAKANTTPEKAKTIITVGKTNATKHNIITATQNTNKIELGQTLTMYGSKKIHVAPYTSTSTFSLSVQ